MTSTELVRQEIRRFLQSPEPEVICVTGDWGVGKTYTWQAELDNARLKNKLGLERYSYASLFGINSLEGLKLALFENLQFLDAPAETYTGKGKGLLKSLGTKAAKFSKLAEGLPTVGQLLSKAGPLYFSAIRNQIVCIDDLERRGTGLEVRDVFGLISFLREQRACKVILLLNAEGLAKDRETFDALFEKVIDTKLIFAPTAAEALEIAITSDDTVAKFLREYCNTLDISNIRVIKKIERLARQIVPHLEKFLPELTQQTLHSLVLFAWTKFQPSIAPPLSYYRVNSLSRHMRRRENKDPVPPDEERWDTILSKYNFSHMDDFDGELMRFVDSGVLDAAAINTQAENQNEKIEMGKKTGSLRKAWRPFHESFDDNLDEVTKSIMGGMKANVAVVSLSNVDSAYAVLKEIGKQKEAKELLDFFVESEPIEFWDPSNAYMSRGALQPDVAAVVDTQLATKAAAEDAAFNTEAGLIDAAKTYNPETIKKLAQVPVAQYVQIFKTKRGDELGRLIDSGLEFRRISNASPEMQEVVQRIQEALKVIASESKLNAARVAKYIKL